LMRIKVMGRVLCAVRIMMVQQQQICVDQPLSCVNVVLS
jgi:hypothetical protein